MSDFLNFLNSADLDTLIKIPGITRTLAENLIFARPFNSTDDCLKIRGMGKNLLARMQSFAEAQESESENRAIMTIEQEASPAPTG
mgnify:FL=1